MVQPSPLPPDPEPTLRSLAATVGVTARAVYRIEKRHERLDDHVAELRKVALDLRGTAKTLAAASLRLAPVPLWMRVIVYAVSGVAGGAVAQLVIATLLR